MSEKEIIAGKVKKTLLQDTVTFTVDIMPANTLQKWLQRLGIQKKQKTYHIRPITYGNLQRIAALLLPIEFDRNNSALSESYTLMERHSETMMKIIATAITNSRHEPSKDLINELYYNVVPKEAMQLVSIILKQMDISGFFHTIVLIRGLNVNEPPRTETSPIVPGVTSDPS